MRDAVTLSNTLSRTKEKFTPLVEGEVGIYSCGPTVYWNQHIGNMYAYIQWDVMVRFFKFLGWKVKWVMNITDVGHMTGDNLGDADTGEDRMEKGAQREGMSVWDLADKYITQFTESLTLLNISKPDVMPRATQHIQEQIDLIKKMEAAGFTYTTAMGVVFDTAKFPAYANFAKLNLEEGKKREDVEVDPEKKNPWDFFLWVTGNTNHVMKWPSPWGEGYPGWHIECTAMSTKYLGNNFDIHTGGIEHIGIHHTNEIAQGFGAFGKQTANYWLHNGWLVDSQGQKVGKSTGGLLTVQELRAKGFDPLAYRYLVLTSHYKKGLKFSEDALRASEVALKNLRELVNAARTQTDRTVLSQEKQEKVDAFRSEFENALADDLNVAKALAVLWSVLKSNIPSEDKYDLALTFDEVLGLNLHLQPKEEQVPEDVVAKLKRRDILRAEGKFAEADKIRIELEKFGYKVIDTPGGSRVAKGD